MILVPFFTFLCLLLNAVSSFVVYQPKGCGLVNWTIGGRKRISAQCVNANYTEVMEYARDQQIYALIIDGCNLPIRQIEPLPNMSVLFLRIVNCGIEEIDDDAFANVTDVIKLELSHNSIKTFPNVEMLTDLHELILEDNKIGNIADSQKFVKNKLLYDVNLRNNKLLEVTDASFSGFESVRNLDLGANQIETISPNAFTKLANLGTLNLGHNNISTLPSKLSNNQLSELPASVFEGLTQLQKLDLTNTTLKELPLNVFSTNKNMKTLYLNFNNLEQLPFNVFKELTNMRELEIHHNKLKRLDESVFPDSDKLFELHLNDNQLDDIPPFRNLVHLIYLNLENNRLTALPTEFVRQSMWLKSIYLNNNRLRSLPDTLFSHLISAPDVIDLRHNNLTTVPISAFGVKKHKSTILLHGNPLNCDEKLAWLVNDIKSETQRVSNPSHPEIPLCAGPSKHSGLPLQNIKLD
uniref:LRRCT domain-containing protein n=1 Tax=Panagrellus redivivus TaxID=6233 RepID=A0A7E4ZST9_PANRE